MQTEIEEGKKRGEKDGLGEKAENGGEKQENKFRRERFNDGGQGIMEEAEEGKERTEGKYRTKAKLKGKHKRTRERNGNPNSWMEN